MDKLRKYGKILKENLDMIVGIGVAAGLATCLIIGLQRKPDSNDDKLHLITTIFGYVDRNYSTMKNSGSDLYKDYLKKKISFDLVYVDSLRGTMPADYQRMVDASKALDLYDMIIDSSKK